VPRIDLLVTAPHALTMRDHAHRDLFRTPRSRPAPAAGVSRQVTRHGPEVIAAQKALHQQWLDLPYSDAVERSIEPLLDAVRAGRPQQAARVLLER
jgi:hypothetical protein